MAEVPFDTLERQQLCDLLAAPGLVLPGRWHRLAARRTATLGERDFASLVDQVRSGPLPGFFRIGWVRRFPNLDEFFVHHEDVRRANGGGPRRNAPDLDAALWRNVARSPWFLARRLRGVNLDLEWAGTTERVRARRGKTSARLVGAPGELLLSLFGRRSAAQVEIEGEPAAVAAIRETSFGM